MQSKVLPIPQAIRCPPTSHGNEMARGGARRAGGVPKGGRKRNILRRVLPWATGCEDYCSRGPAPMTPGGRVRSSHPSPVHTRRALRRPDGGRRGLTVTPAVWVRPYSAETAQTAQTAGAQIAAHVKTRKRSHTNLKPQDILMPPLSAHKGQGGVHWTRQQGHGVPQYIDCRQAHGPSQAPSASHHTRLYIVEFELFGSV